MSWPATTSFWSSMAVAEVRDRLRIAVSRYVEAPVTRLLIALRVSPDAVTVSGFAVVIAAACLAGLGMLLAAGILFLAGSWLDMYDGALARATHRVSQRGALLDSVLDRLSEGALLTGVAVWAATSEMGQSRVVATLVLVLAALLFSQMVSYVRARGEGLGLSCKVGWMTRSERVVIFGLGLILEGLRLDPALVVALGFVAGVSAITTVQRFLHVRRQIGG